MTLRIVGKLYSGRSALAEDAVAICTNSGHISCESSERESVLLSDVRISERVGAIPRTMMFPDGVMFETSDNDLVDQWLGQCGQRTSWRHRLERNSTIAGIALVVTALVVLISVKWGIPAFSDYVVELLPPEVDTAIAAGALEALDDGIFEPSKLPEADQNDVRERFQRLVPTDANINFQIFFRRGGLIGANAFALPDGSVVVTDELIALSTHPDELGSVLLHEIGHVVNRHSLRQVIRHSWLAMLGLLIIGDVSSAGSLVLALPSVLVQSAYSRDFESEADDYALIKMRDIGLEPFHFANFMERIERCALYDKETLPECVRSDDKDGTDANTEHGGWLKYLSTHPANADRIARFKELD